MLRPSGHELDWYHYDLSDQVYGRSVFAINVSFSEVMRIVAVILAVKNKYS